MTEVPIVMHPDGFPMTLGYRRRAFEPRSTVYNWTNYERASTVDLTQPRVFWGNKPDPRLPILNQGHMGACVSFGVFDAVTALARLMGMDAVELMHDFGYWWARVKEGTFPQDAGSDPSDMLDLCLAGVPPESLQPGGYTDDPSVAFGQYAPQATLKYIQSFHPIYPTDGPNLQTLVWQSLDAGYPLDLATLWTQACFSPTKGMLPSGQTPAQEIGGHDVFCWGIVPGYYLADNSWTPQWAPDAADSGFIGMRPGSFAIPWEYGQPHSLIESMRVIVGIAQPTPTPAPTPTPTPVPPNPQPSFDCRVASEGVVTGVEKRMIADYRAQRINFQEAQAIYLYLLQVYQGDANLPAGVSAAGEDDGFPAPPRRLA